MDIRCTTELDAVNLCLEAVGEQPVNVIPTSGVTEATIAQKVLARISREVQNKGLHCNTEEGYTLLPNLKGEILIPPNALDLDPTDPQEDYVWRGGRLYDRKKHQFTFDKGVKFDITWFLPFEDLPEHVRHYVAVRSARVFQRNFLGSTNLNSMSQEDEQWALVNFQRNESLAEDRTMISTSTPRAILHRRI